MRFLLFFTLFFICFTPLAKGAPLNLLPEKEVSPLSIVSKGKLPEYLGKRFSRLDTDDGKEFLTKAEKKYQFQEDPHLIFAIKALLFLQENNVPESDKYINKALSIRASNSDVLTIKALIESRKEDPSPALKYFQEARFFEEFKIISSGYFSYLFGKYLVLSGGDNNLATNLLLLASQSGERFQDLPQLRVITAIRSGDRNAALTAADRLGSSIEEKMLKISALNLAADPLLHHEDIQKASWLAKSLFSEKEKIPAEIKAQLYPAAVTSSILLGELEQAKEYAEEGLKEFPENPEVLKMAKQVEVEIKARENLNTLKSKGES